MHKLNTALLKQEPPCGPGAAVVEAARGIPPTEYVRSQCLIGVGGDCVCFVVEAYKRAGVESSDNGSMLCAGFGGSQLTDRLHAQGFVRSFVPIPGAIVVYTWSHQPQHLAIVTDVCYDTGLFNIRHLCASMGGIVEHPSTGPWTTRFHSIWIPESWLDELPPLKCGLSVRLPLPKLNLPGPEEPLRGTSPLPPLGLPSTTR